MSDQGDFRPRDKLIGPPAVGDVLRCPSFARGIYLNIAKDSFDLIGPVWVSDCDEKILMELMTTTIRRKFQRTDQEKVDHFNKHGQLPDDCRTEERELKLLDLDYTRCTAEFVVESVDKVTVMIDEEFVPDANDELGWDQKRVSAPRDGHLIVARRLNADGTFDRDGQQIRFYLLSERSPIRDKVRNGDRDYRDLARKTILDADIKLVRRMTQVFI